jgi:hypothetical protein
LHVIGESPEARVSPAGIDLILQCVSKSTERFEMPVTDPLAAELCRQSVVVELRIVSRTRNGAHIYELLDPMRFQQPDEFIQRMRRVTDRIDVNYLFHLLELLCRKPTTSMKSPYSRRHFNALQKVGKMRYESSKRFEYDYDESIKQNGMCG